MNPEVYCGPAPIPETLWQSWNFDPMLIAALIAATGALWLRPARSASGAADRRYHRAAGSAAVFVLAIAFISPLCALSSALFSARIAHHVLLIAIAAPLIALAWPALIAKRPGLLSVAFLVHTALVWLWHAPQPYAFALSSDLAYWTMELSLLASAVLLWQAIFAAGQDRPGGALATLLGSVIQMGMLGALLTFARTPLYAHHLATTEAFGLTPLADQQLAGILMWVPAAVPYLVAALVVSSAMVREKLVPLPGHDR